MITIEYKTSGQKFYSVNSLPENAINQYEPTKKEFYNDLLNELKQDPIMNTQGVFGVSTFIAKKVKVNEAKFNEFIKLYGEILEKNMSEKPHEYVKSFETTFSNMSFAVLSGSFNKDSESFKETCKKLKIKHTYKAINEYLEIVK